MVGPEACCWRPGSGATTRARASAGLAPGCYVKSASATTTLRKSCFTHIIYSLFTKLSWRKSKNILQSERAGGKVTRTELLFSEN